MKLVRTKGKGQKWKKGQSCVSNAPKTKHREDARGRFFQKLEGESGLTENALADHNKVMLQISNQLTGLNVEEDDVQSGGKTFNTIATNFSTCTLSCFSRFFAKFDPTSDKHKRMLAVHAAVQEYMTSQDIEENNQNYCSALLVSARGVMDSEEDLAATMSLLARVIRKIDINSLRKYFRDYSNLFTSILEKYSESSRLPVIENVIGCISVVLRAQDKSAWDNPYLHDLLNIILKYCVDERHKIRKSAQYNVSAILMASSFMITDKDDDEDAMQEESEEKPFIVHPASKTVADFVESMLCSPSDLTKRKQTLHLLVLLRQIIMAFPKKQLKKVCEWILSVMQLGDTLVNTNCLQCLFNLFASNPPLDVLNSKTNIALINAMTSQHGATTASGSNLIIIPNMSDNSGCKIWIATVTTAVSHLYKLDQEKAVAKMDVWFEMLLQFLKSDHEEVHIQICDSFEYLIEECIGKLESRISEEPYTQYVCNIISTIEKGLSLQFQHAWDFVFKTFGVAFQQIGPLLPLQFNTPLKNLCDLYINSENTNKKLLEQTIGKAITGLGPKVFAVDIVSVQITGAIKEDEKYIWALPLLKKYVKKTNLQYFIDYFYPLAIKCFEILKALKLKGLDKSLLYKVYQTIEIQIWAALPSFAIDPLDIDEVLEDEIFARTLAEHIKQRDDTRTDILLTLRNLINASVGRKNKLQLYAKNYLPILFNIYRSPGKTETGGISKGNRLAAFETIKVYIKILPDAANNHFMNKVIEKYESEEEVSKVTLLDLARIFLPYVGEENYEKIHNLLLKSLDTDTKENDTTKALYKLLETYLDVIKNHEKISNHELLWKITSSLTKAASSTKANCRGPRLKCLRVILENITSNMDKETCRNIIKVIVGVIITSCGRAQSVATKKAVYGLLSQVGATIQIVEECSPEDMIDNCLAVFLAGLSGSPTLVSNTVLAITTLSYQHKDLLQEENAIKILDNIILLMTHKAYEVIESCLSFIKASIHIFPTVVLSNYVEKIIKAICSIDELAQRKSRMKTRDILSNFIRKFGADRITSLVPENNIVMQKRVRALRKIEAKKKRMKVTDEDELDDDEDDTPTSSNLPSSMDDILGEIEESDDDEEDEKFKKTKKKGKKVLRERKIMPKKGAWIKEDEDDIVDLLDTAANQKILTKAPRKVTSDEKTKKEDDSSGGFPIDVATGKLIINEPKREKIKEMKETKKNEMTVDDCDAYMHMRAGAIEGKIKKRKRTLSEDSEDETVNQITAAKSVEKKAAKKKKFDYGAEYRAKKAGGDVKLKGKVDPFAYVGFTKDRLNKRKTAKYAGQLKTLVKGAKKGAAKGSKMRRNNKK